jgi:hypothetical protein
MAYFHAIIKVSPPVQTRMKKFAQILGMCFSNVFVFFVLGPKFLNVVFYSLFCIQFHFSSFLIFFCFNVSWRAYDDIRISPDLYYSFFIKNE